MDKALKNMEVKVSVIMCVYKEPLEWLSESISSILNQTFTDLELIIVNDNPEGLHVKTFLDDYCKKDKRVTVINNVDNLGLAQSRNNGIKIANGKYLAFMDADDISLPSRLQKQYQYLENNLDIDVLGTWAKVFNGHGKVIGFFRNRVDPVYNKMGIMFATPLTNPTVMIRKSLLLENNIFLNPEFKNAEDYELWSRIVEIGAISNIPEFLLMYRRSDNQMSTNKKEEQDYFRDLIQERILKQKFKNITDRQLLIHSELISSKDSKTNLEDKLEWIYFLLNSKTFSREEKKYLNRIILVIMNIYVLNTKSLCNGYFILLALQKNMGYFDAKINLSYWKNRTQNLIN